MTPHLSVVLATGDTRIPSSSPKGFGDQAANRNLYELISIGPSKSSSLRYTQLEGNSSISFALPKHIHCPLSVMHNVGIVAAKGDLIALCEPEVSYPRDFLASIMDVFDREQGIVLSLDEPRTVCAKREDLIAVGGVDEQMADGLDDLVSRLASAGKRDIRRPARVPARRNGANGSALPRIENAAIRMLRTGEAEDLYALLLEQALPSEEMPRAIGRSGPSSGAVRVFLEQVRMKVFRFSRRLHNLREIRGKIRTAHSFIRTTLRTHRRVREELARCFDSLAASGVTIASLYADGTVVRLARPIARRHRITLRVLSEDAAADAEIPVELAPLFEGPVVVGGVGGGVERSNRILSFGVPRDRIVLLA